MSVGVPSSAGRMSSAALVHRPPPSTAELRVYAPPTMVTSPPPECRPPPLPGAASAMELALTVTPVSVTVPPASSMPAPARLAGLNWIRPPVTMSVPPLLRMAAAGARGAAGGVAQDVGVGDDERAAVVEQRAAAVVGVVALAVLPENEVPSTVMVNPALIQKPAALRAAVLSVTEPPETVTSSGGRAWSAPPLPGVSPVVF